MASRAGKIVRNVLLGLVGGLVLLLAVVQIALSDKVLTRIVNRIAADYVDGTVRFDRVHASVLKSFPFLNVTADGLEVTYPHEMFAAYDSDNVEGEDFLLRAGRGESVDTLLSVSSLSASIDYVSAFRGQYHLRHATLSRPRIFAHYYDSTAANWRILRFLHSDDTTSSSLPPLTVRKLSLDDRPHIVYTNPADTLFGVVALHTLDFQGNILVDDLLTSTVDLKVDSLFVAGRIPADTIAVRLSSLGVKGDRNDLSVEASADAWLATGSRGRMKIPVAVKAQGALPDRADKVMEVRVDKLGLDVSTLSLEGNGDVVLYPGKPYIRAEAEIDDASVDALVQSFGDNFPVLRKIKTDAKVSLTALCDGYYEKETRSLPELIAEVVIPEAHLKYEGFPYDGYVSLLAEAETDTQGRLDADIKELMIDALGVELMASGTVSDALGEDPAIKADGFFDTDVKALTDLFTWQRGITGRGDISGDLSVKALLSQILDLSKIGDATAAGNLNIRRLHIDDAPDTLTVEVNKAAAALAIKGNTLDGNLRRGARVLSLDSKFDTLDVTYRDNIYVRGGNLKLQAQNSAAILKGGSSLTPFMGVFSGDAVSLRDASDLSLEIADTQESFRITPATKASPVPVLSLTSSSNSVVVRKDVNRVALDGLDFSASASRAASKSGARQRMSRRLDSLQRVYPGVPRDSLLRHAYASRRRPSWLTDKSFAEKDINIKLDKSLASYIQDWDFSGNLTLGNGLVITPYFPLETRVSDVSGSFNNDQIDLSNIYVNSGESDISASATLSGLRRALTSGRGRLKLVADVNSDYIDANELMRGYASGSRYEPTRYDKSLNDGLGSDEVYQKKVGETVVSDSVARASLIVIPSNLEAEITLNANRIKYDSLLVTWAASEIAMKQRCLQVTNTVATSNMGDIYFEGFYSTQTRRDIQVGFDLNMVDITAEKVITLFPALDTIVPMLKSFAGLLDCELAATADMDEKMNIKLPTIDGVMRVSGKDLSLRDSEQFTKIAKVLMFKNKQEARVDKIGVTGIVRDNTLEIFPFVMKVDRYTVAASGIQHLDKSYKYHLSVLRSPLLVRFGLNIFGDNFDEMKYRVGKAKYKNTQVPVFTKQLDTVQYSLINSIHNIFEKGVAKAIRENQEQQIVQDRMRALDYSMEAEVDTLTRAQLDSLRMMQDSLSVQEQVAAKIDTLRAQERDASEFEEENVGSLRQAARAGKKAERQVEKAIRKQQRQQKKAAAKKPDE